MKSMIFERGSQLVVFWVMALVLTNVPLHGDDQLDGRRRSGKALGDTAALRRAIEDLTTTFGAKYPKGREYLRRLTEIENQSPNGTKDEGIADSLLTLQREALLANPLLDFERLLLVKRKSNSPRLGLPMNWQGNSSLPRTGFDDELAVLSPVQPEGQLTTLYKPEG
ncbi:MAG: hypothetical protein QGF59_18740, partial [Pirellulaceae bacterium]|nr:hypothetical protein [Pirellulaceae bacterium]